MLRAVAALLVAVLASSTLAPATCAGWQATPADRMACCERAEHDCPDQSAADACCAQQEETHQPATTLSAIALSAPSTLAPIIVSAPDLSGPQNAASRRYEAFAALPLHAPPGAFALPLRI
jgi:hypothetical protein